MWPARILGHYGFGTGNSWVKVAPRRMATDNRALLEIKPVEVHHLRPGIHKLLDKCGFGNRIDIQSTHLVRIGLVVVFRMDGQSVMLGRELAREAIMHHCKNLERD